jgi:NDP-sugar pyrophosphorylase family protein
VFPIHEYWTDVGRPDDLARAEDRHRASSAT